MKITISATLVTALSATAANLALHIQGLRDSHPYLKTETEKTTKNYTMNGILLRMQTINQIHLEKIADIMQMLGITT